MLDTFVELQKQYFTDNEDNQFRQAQAYFELALSQAEINERKAEAQANWLLFIAFGLIALVLTVVLGFAWQRSRLKLRLNRQEALTLQLEKSQIAQGAAILETQLKLQQTEMLLKEARLKATALENDLRQDLLRRLRSRLLNASRLERKTDMQKDLRRVSADLLRQEMDRPGEEGSRDDLQLFAQEEHLGFVSWLKTHATETLTNREIRLAILVRMHRTNKEIATLLGIEPDSVKKAKTRLRQKFQLHEGQKLEDFLSLNINPK
jgi:hypothetical protein